MESVVFLIDEDAAATDMVHRVASMMNLSCHAFTSGQEFLASFARSQGGCLVTELKVRDVSGLRILERLVEEGSMLPVIFVTGHGSLPIAVRAMRAGAFHFLEKPVREQELWDAIQDAVRTDQENREAAQREAAIQDRLGSLTVREEQVLRLIAEGKPNRAIARDLGLSMRTIEVRRNALMTKLRIETPEELLRFAIVACNERYGANGLARSVRWRGARPAPHGNGHREILQSRL